MAHIFKLQEYCLRAMGHSHEPHSSGSSSGSGAGALSLKHVVSLLFAASAQYPLIHNVVYHRNDMELATAGMSVLLTNLLTLFKIATFLVYKQDFWRMIQSFRQMHQQSSRNIRDGDGYGYVAEANKLASLLGRAYCTSCAATGLYFMVSPILKIIANSWRGTTYVRELPMPLRLPFNYVDSPGYEIGFVYILLVTIVVVSYASAVDGLFISFAINLRAHFQTLQRDIRTTDFSQSEHEFQKALKDLVDYHIRLLTLSKRLRVMYMPIVFGQFFITSLQVGVIIYQLVTNMDSIMALLVYLSFLGSIMLQLFIYCYGGEIIKVESHRVDVAVQLSNWYQAAPKLRRSLAFIILRSQRDLLIKAGFYEASLGNFLAICRAALSFITLIKSIE
ncbi:odorant receptor 82a [Drosophila pseudoobscura]|uniref:Odorant receptor n=1 Tax=Drosophila pseudoobscura pseudoobscura TaxID=46245 RepID=A0A6I8WE49_DROPS|nr:odorant receptor 82a [Drosophila pseudoobscura]XP_033241711.1 odorant receptor 82a [Drosophila pseudoobscura]